METIEEARRIILKELISEDTEVRAEFLKRFQKEVDKFADEMAHAVVNWGTLDAQVKQNEKVAYISAFTFTAINVHILSMKLFISGQAIAAGNLFRQALESIAMAFLYSGKDVGVIERFVKGEYSTSDSIRDVIRHANRLGLNKGALDDLRKAQEFYHKYSHPSYLTIAAVTSLSEKAPYVGAAFDEAKIESYTKEINIRVGLAKVFSNFVDGVKANISKSC